MTVKVDICQLTHLYSCREATNYASVLTTRLFMTIACRWLEARPPRTIWNYARYASFTTVGQGTVECIDCVCARAPKPKGPPFSHTYHTTITIDLSHDHRDARRKEVESHFSFLLPFHLCKSRMLLLDSLLDHQRFQPPSRSLEG
jgi:hypothetical protein